MPTSAKDDVRIIWLHTIASWFFFAAIHLSLLFFVKFSLLLLRSVLFHFILHEWSSTNTFEVLIYLFCIWNINNNNSNRKKWKENALPPSMNYAAAFDTRTDLHRGKVAFEKQLSYFPWNRNVRYSCSMLPLHSFYAKNEKFYDIFIAWSRFN